jgi:drug/metabolite transporter (DMT)-like permease
MGVMLSSASTICLALAGILYSYCFWLKPNLNPSILVMIRVLVGFLPPLFFLLKKKSILKLMGNNRIDLVFWGLAGSATVTTFFFSSQKVGVGITQMLSSVQGFVFFFGAPILLNESRRWNNLIGLVLSIIGLNYILISRMPLAGQANGITEISNESLLFGIASGIFGGIAYLFMARCRKTNSPEVIAFYWAVPSFLLQLVLLFYGHNAHGGHFYSIADTELQLPNSIWLYAFGGGSLTALSQILLSESYKHGNVVLLTLITYLGPLINILADVVFGKVIFSANLLVGVFLIVFGSGVFPLLSQASFRSALFKFYKVHIG